MANLTSLYSVSNEHALNGEEVFPTASLAHQYAVELVAGDESQATVTEILVRTQPNKSEICDMLNNSSYVYESRVMYTVTPEFNDVQAYLRKEQEELQDAMASNRAEVFESINNLRSDGDEENDNDDIN